MSALKDADDVDETASKSDMPDEVKKQNDRLEPQSKAELLKIALGDVRTIESGAQNLLARSLKGDVGATALRKRLREEFLIDVLGVLESYLDTETFQLVKQKLKGTL